MYLYENCIAILWLQQMIVPIDNRFDNKIPGCNYDRKSDTCYILMTYCLASFQIQNFVQLCTEVKVQVLGDKAGALAGHEQCRASTPTSRAAHKEGG